MTDNAVLRLRAERLARATRPFLARGNRIHRCQRCLLPLKQCLCATLNPVAATSRFCLVMFDTEPMKPSNTGRLIADILPDTEAFQWSRTEPPQALLDLVADPQYQPMVVFPASYADAERQVLDSPLPGKPPLFIMLDGTWPEAHAEGQYCTAEVAIALLDLAGDKTAPAALGDHFSLFRTRYLAGKTQHKGSITAQLIENV